MNNTILEQLMGTGMSEEQAMELIAQIEEKAIAKKEQEDLQRQREQWGFIRARREELGKTLRDMKEITGISVNALANWEKFNSFPEFKNVGKLIDGYGFNESDELELQCYRMLRKMAEQRATECASTSVGVASEESC